MKLNFLQKKPFYVFEIENFFSDKEYDKLYRNFPQINKNDLSKLSTKGIIYSPGNKAYFTNHSETYKSLEKNECIKLIEKIFNERFLLKFYKKIYKQIILSRPFDIFNLYTFLRKAKFTKENKKKSLFEKIFYSNFRYTYEFSYIFKDGYIIPHTDAKAKVVSILLYFPDKEQENLSIGTTFYKCKLKNFSNNYDIYHKNKEAFYNNVESKFTLKFKKKSLYCFIKSENSWHAVEKINIPEDKVRKSININLNI